VDKQSESSVTVFTNFFNQLQRPDRQSQCSTLLFIINVDSAIFKPNAPFSAFRTFIHYVCHHFTQLPIDFYRFLGFFANKNRITDRVSQLTGFSIAAHISKLNIEKTGRAIPAVTD